MFKSEILRLYCISNKKVDNSERGNGVVGDNLCISLNLSSLLFGKVVIARQLAQHTD